MIPSHESAPSTAPASAAPRVVSDTSGNRFSLRAVSCPTCGDAAPLREIGRRGGASHRYGLGVETTIVQCQRCTLLFPSPFPFPVNPQALYGDPDKYFENFEEGWKVADGQRLIRRARALRGGQLSTLLDVGSGRAEMLRAAALEGIDAVGLELSQAMIERARERHGITLLPQSIEELAAQTERRFDVVMLCAILEHVYDPAAMMASVQRLTVPGGLVYLDIPNEPNLLTRLGNLINRALGSRAVYNLSPTWSPYHVYGFNPTALLHLLRRHAFEVIDVKIHAVPRIAARGGLRDRLKALLGTGVNHLANWTGTASNMYVWARRRPAA